MIHLFKDITLTWWQVGIFKLSLLSFGVFVGVRFPELFEGWTTILLVIFIVTTLYLLRIWWKNWNS